MSDIDLSCFREIPGYQGYYAAQDGTVLSTAWGKRHKLSQWVNSNGYLACKLGNRQLTVHRAVALAWIENPNGNSDVNHIDGNKMNNHPRNLEWCSRSENLYHALRTGLHVNREVPVVGTHAVTKEVVRFHSQSEAVKHGFKQANISKCLNGLRPTHRGYTWRCDEDSSG